MARRFSFLFLFLLSCTAGRDAQVEECRKGIGEACNQLGKSLDGLDALTQFRRACDLGNTNGCVNLAERTNNADEAKRVLKFSCDKGNTNACAKYAELLVKGKSPD